MKKLVLIVLAIVSCVCLALGLSACDGYNQATEHEHALAYTAAVAATCTDNGNTEYWYCSGCGKYYSDESAENEISQTETVITAFGHDYTGAVTQEATCIEKGITTYTCSVCGDSYSEEIAMTEHSYTSTVTKEATCTEKGIKTYTCSVCGGSYTEEIAMIEHSYTSAVTKEATCAEKGIKTYTCSVCGDSYTEEIAKTSHTEVTDAAVAATCTQTGLTEGSHCSVCGEVIVAQKVTEKIAHSLVQVEGKAATCTEGGYDAYACTVCGYTTYKETDALGHDYKDEVTVEPTYETTGVRTYTCTRCGDSYTETIAVIGHTHSYTSAVTTAPTCISTGVRTYTCTLCGLKYYETIEKTDHTKSAAVKENVKDATCTANGSYQNVVYCSVCGEEISRTTVIVNATGHNWNSGVITTEPTCTTVGVKTYTCTVCGDTKTETVAATGHSYGEWTVSVEPTLTSTGTLIRYCVNDSSHNQTVTLPVLNQSDYVYTLITKATCITEGKATYSYSKNGQSFVFSATIAKTAHTETTDAAVAATCTASGLTAGSHCSVCGQIIVEQTVIPATGHTYSGWTVVQAATCEESGYEHKVCTVCGIELETQTIAAIGHSYGEWAISVEPTLTSTGTLVKTCANDSTHKQTATLPALNQTDYTYTLINAASCSAEGKATYSYNKDGQYFAFSVTIAKTAHTEVADDAVAATCTTSGLSAGSHCSVCGQIIVEQTVIPATGHTPVITKEGVSATCSSSGLTEEIECSVCGYIIQEQTAIAALSHTDSDHDYICDTCGELTPDESEYTKISTVNGLKSIIGDMSGLYMLTANIDISGSNWSPIGSSSIPFTGLLNGNGYKITGLTFSDSSSISQTEYALFIKNSGTIANVELTDITISINCCNDYIAGLVVNNSGIIINCKISGTNKITIYQEYSATLAYSSSDNTSKTYTNNLGGICVNNNKTIQDCTISDSFTINVTVYGYYYHSNTAIVLYPTISGTMTFTENLYFGCIASINNGTISGCKVSATSTVNATVKSYARYCTTNVYFNSWCASIVGIDNGTITDTAAKALVHNISMSADNDAGYAYGYRTIYYSDVYEGLIGGDSDAVSQSKITFLD